MSLVVCPTCAKKLNVDARLGGQQISCPNCNDKFVCPTAPAPTLDAGVAKKPPPPAGTAYLGATDDPLQLPKTPPTSATQKPTASVESRSVPEILEDILMVMAEDHDLRKKMSQQMRSINSSLFVIGLWHALAILGAVIWVLVLMAN